MSAFIDEHRSVFGVEPTCRSLGIAPSSYYAVLARQRMPSARTRRDAEWLAEIRRVHTDSRGRHGGAQGVAVAPRGHPGRQVHGRAADAPGQPAGRRQRQAQPTTIVDEAAERPTDLVERDFTAEAPNRLWVADFTYVMCFSGVDDVAFVIDAFSRPIVAGRPTPR